MLISRNYWKELIFIGLFVLFIWNKALFLKHWDKEPLMLNQNFKIL